MSKLGLYAKRVSRVILDYAVIWTLGNVLGITFWLLVLFGVIRIHGHTRLLRAAWRGHLIIATNHPTLVETLFIPCLGWPWMLVSRRYFFWCMPDYHLFPSWLKWLHSITRGIEVDRKAKFNLATIRQSRQVLMQKNTLSLHVEGGRTFKWQERQVRLLHYGDRQLSEVKAGVFILAETPGVRILPLWVDMSPQRQQQLSFRHGAAALFKRGFGPITLSFDHPAYAIQQPLDVQVEKHKLECYLLNAPLETLTLSAAD